MGRSARHHDTLHSHPALSGLPSPASVTGSLDTPTFDYVLSGSRSHPQQLTPRDDILEGILPTLPDDICTQPLMTPLTNDMPEQSMDMIVGGALAPVPTSASRLSLPPTIRSTGPGLRLPSFERLGIAAPHPDRVRGGSLDSAIARTATEPMLDSLSGPHTDSDLIRSFDNMRSTVSKRGEPSFNPPLKGSGRAIRSPIHHFVDMLTPPADTGDINWNTTTPVQNAALDSPSTDLGLPPLPNIPHTAPDDGTTAGLSTHLQTSEEESEEEWDVNSWAKGAIDVLRKHHYNLNDSTC